MTSFPDLQPWQRDFADAFATGRLRVPTQMEIRARGRRAARIETAALSALQALLDGWHGDYTIEVCAFRSVDDDLERECAAIVDRVRQLLQVGGLDERIANRVVARPRRAA